MIIKLSRSIYSVLLERCATQKCLFCGKYALYDSVWRSDIIHSDKYYRGDVYIAFKKLPNSKVFYYCERCSCLPTDCYTQAKIVMENL